MAYILTDYIQAAMSHADYRILEDGSFEGEIQGLADVWSHAPTLESCRLTLRQVLEEWIVQQLYDNHAIPPVIDGVNLDPYQENTLEDAIDCQEADAILKAEKLTEVAS